MRWKSSTHRYGAVAVAMHWVTAVALIGMLVSGLRAADMSDPAAKLALLRIHAVMGVSVLALTLLRLFWWWLADKKPVDPAGTPLWQARAARIVHGLFYVVIIGMGASGIGMVLLSGAGDILAGASQAQLPYFHAYPPRAPHGIGGTLLIALVLLHVVAAIYHQFVKRDRLLARMGLGR